MSQAKISFVFASINAYNLAAIYGATAVVYGALSAATASVPVASVLFGLGGTAATGLAALFTAIAVGDQANAADPPAEDPNFKQLYTFDEGSIQTFRGFKEVRTSVNS